MIKKYYGIIAILIFLSSFTGLFYGCPFLKHWFYLVAWWSYIFLADWLVLRLRGTSRLTSSPKQFLSLALWSVFFWLVFEWFNLFLKNWAYLAVPSDIRVRWLGYTLAFATVLPGIFETYDLLGLLIPRPFRGRPLGNPFSWFPWLILVGLLCLLLPVAYPRYFFPLVWAGFVFLLEPANYLQDRSRSLLYDLERGDFRRPVLLLLAGTLCGLFWESWNYWAETKWIYTLPWDWLMRVKLFEMPLPGYLGFPPFALECWSMWVFSSFTLRKLPRSLSFFLLLAFYAFMFAQIDLHTVRQFRP